jgi:ATP-dependent Clp protease ATP-binding subunit ClpA
MEWGAWTSTRPPSGPHPGRGRPARAAAGRRRPAAIAAQIEEEADEQERTDVAPSLSPDAKAPAGRLRGVARSARRTWPEHVLALAQDSETEAGELLERFAISTPSCAARSSAGSRAARPWPSREHDEDARRVRPRPHGGGQERQARSVIGRADQIEQTIEILSRRTRRTTPSARRPGSARLRSSRASPADRER